MSLLVLLLFGLACGVAGYSFGREDAQVIGPETPKYRKVVSTEKIVQLRSKGLTLQEIGNIVGMSPQSVHYRLKKS